MGHKFVFLRLIKGRQLSSLEAFYLNCIQRNIFI